MNEKDCDQWDEIFAVVPFIRSFARVVGYDMEVVVEFLMLLNARPRPILHGILEVLIYSRPFASLLQVPCCDIRTTLTELKGG